ncbi:MAG: hypothetical protein ACO3UU_15590, partial [Minisyncoccia bacterium]
EVGFYYHGRFLPFENPPLLRPLTKTDTTLDVYYGNQYECIKNTKLGSVVLPYRDVWSLSVRKEDNQWVIFLDETSIAVFEEKEPLTHGEEPDEVWLKWHNAKMEYIDYIYELKSTLYDNKIKESIEGLEPDFPVYSKLMEKFERAEQICYLEGISTEEYVLALAEIQFFIDPIMKKIIESERACYS